MASAAELLESLYPELHAVAARHLQHCRRGTTLQPTALLHEAYLRVAGRSDWSSRNHFLAAVCRAMRHVMVDYVRDMDRREARGRSGSDPE